MDQLVAMTDADLKEVLMWRNAPRVRENMYSQHEISWDEHLAWWAASKARNDRRYFIFEQGGKKTGFVSFTDMDEGNGTASWAFFSSTNAPKGTGTKMERAALNIAFKALGMRKLCCEVLDFNYRVIEFHQRFGFQIEGRLKAHKLVKGRYCDVVLLAVFAEHWADMQNYN